MKVWAIANQKGGVGKTTTAITLAGVMHNRGHRVLLIDLDPHGSLTSYFRLDPDDVEPSVYNLFHQTADAKSVVRQTGFEHISFLPASTALATLDRQLGTKDGMGLVIKKTLGKLEQDFDYVLIDCPPMLGLLMVNALAACDRLLIPVQTEFLALKGLERMVHTIGMIQKARKQTINYTIVPTFFDRRLKASNDSLITLRNTYKDSIWEGFVPIDTLFRDSSRQGIPLSIARPSCRGSRAYSHLLDYLEDNEADISYQLVNQENEA
ncbi:MAG: ParA family protein [Gammaproteobacteria bacterium]|nr:ParA family protein [Gammaproteobacteria bacterium]MDH5735457.1 ParA family protein [Gammaproteobacteria bacterium]